MSKINPFKKTFSSGKIGTGKFFTAGKLSGKNRTGLGGALRNLKGAGLRSYAKNLSSKDLKIFQGLISDEMKNLSLHSKGLSYKSRARIMTKAEKMVKKGAISTEDKKDLKKIVEALGPNSSNQALHRLKKPKERVVNFNGRYESNQKVLSPKVQKNIQAGIRVDVSREMEDEIRGVKSRKVYSGSSLKRQETKDNSTTNSSKGRKVELPNIDNLSDLDIG